MSTKVFSPLRFAGIVAVVATSLALSVDRLAAQSRPASTNGSQSNVIEPYNGPPIYLDEAEVIAEPTIVRREMVPPEKYPDGTVRVERQVAYFSDNHIGGGRHLPRIPPQWKAVHRRPISTGPAARRMDVLFRRREGQPQGALYQRPARRRVGCLPDRRHALGQTEFQKRDPRRRVDHLRRNRQEAAPRRALCERQGRRRMEVLVSQRQAETADSVSRKECGTAKRSNGTKTATS